VVLGDLVFRDQNKDGVINNQDRIVLGSDIPGITYGFTFSLWYRNVDLSLFGQGMGRVQQLVTFQQLLPFFNGGKPTIRHLDRSTPQTPHASNPRTPFSQTHNYDVVSTASVIEADYMRLKNLQVGYTLPQHWADRIHMSRLRIYA